MKNLNRLFISLLVLFVSIFCSGCLAGSKLDNALEQINHTSYTLEIKTYQYWEGKYSLSEMIAYKESIIYQMFFLLIIFLMTQLLLMDLNSNLQIV